MINFKITYGHEFVSQSIRDELILYSITDYKSTELQILEDVKSHFGFDPGIKRNIQTLSGGQRVICFIITLVYILLDRSIIEISLDMKGLLESLTEENRLKLLLYIKSKGIICDK